MTRIRHRIGIAVLLALVLLAVPSGGVLAGPLDDAKRAGSVGERPDGYLGVVDEDAGAEMWALVDEINGKRREKYREIAAKNGTSVEAVAALAGAKLAEKTPPGQYLMTLSGKWVRKPAP
jgi:uncharacterized protein YdbL (DUF1318 family)